MCVAVSAYSADRVTLKVSNPATVVRSNEVVEVDAKAVRQKLGTDGSMIVTDADGNELASQVTHDGKLIFQASVAAKGKSVYYVKEGTPKEYKKQAKGRLF